MFGVFRKGCPAHPIESQRWSSVTMNTMFGRRAAAASIGAPQTDPAMSSLRVSMLSPNLSGTAFRL
jgi:hypothetical protein